MTVEGLIVRLKDYQINYITDLAVKWEFDKAHRYILDELYYWEETMGTSDILKAIQILYDTRVKIDTICK